MDESPPNPDFFEKLKSIFEEMPTTCGELCDGGYWEYLITFLDRCPICGAKFEESMGMFGGRHMVHRDSDFLH